MEAYQWNSSSIHLPLLCSTSLPMTNKLFSLAIITWISCCRIQTRREMQLTIPIFSLITRQYTRPCHPQVVRRLWYLRLQYLRLRYLRLRYLRLRCLRCLRRLRLPQQKGPSQARLQELQVSQSFQVSTIYTAAGRAPPCPTRETFR